jgi:hypothetical protein
MRPKYASGKLSRHIALFRIYIVLAAVDQANKPMQKQRGIRYDCHILSLAVQDAGKN